MSVTLSECTVLIVDDTPANIRILTEALKGNYKVSVAKSAMQALKYIEDNLPDLILLDIMMPQMDGFEACSILKADKRTRDIPVIFISALSESENKTRGFEVGGVDYITKPFQIVEVKARVRTHLELKQYRDNLEKKVGERTEELKKVVYDLDCAHHEIKAGYLEAIYRLTLASEYKDMETGAHIKRISLFTQVLAEMMGLDGDFIDLLYHSSPMHDLGKVAIPDCILLKKSGLTSEEWETMKTHTTMGARILEGSKSPYLQMARQIALYHHERWDGTGYPEGLKGEEIPLAARITNIVDQYDALRSRRPYKLASDHETARDIILNGDGRTLPAHFDPMVFDAFARTADMLKEIYNEHVDSAFHFANFAN